MVTEIAIVDELASSAELVMGKTLKFQWQLLEDMNIETIALDDDR